MAKLLLYLLSFLNYLIPKNSKMVAIYGRSMLNDNADALLGYMVRNHYYEKYKLYLLVRNSVKHSYHTGVKVVNNSILTIYYALRAKYIFHTQGMSLCKHFPCQGQIVFNLWHGSALKGIGAMNGEPPIPKTDSFFLCASPLFVNINKKCFLISDSQVFIGGNPRNDLLFNKIDVKSLFGWKINLKVVVFMPTFRKSKGLNREDSNQDFPILNELNTEKLNQFLKTQNILLVIKPHPYQNDIGFLHRLYSNIKVLYNEDLYNKGIKLYEMLGNTDALLTDYSSVYFDYLLTDKPIGFTIDDFEIYGKNRGGYAISNPLEMMPGVKIKSFDELTDFLKNVSNGKDDFVNVRHRVNELCNSYTTPDASKRILDFCGITKY